MASVHSLSRFMARSVLISDQFQQLPEPGMEMPYWKAPSDALRVAQAQKLADGALLSLRKGRWLNRFITIHFGKAKLQSNARPFLGWYLKQSRDWLAYRDAGPISYIATFENKGGFHVHVLMHVPYPLWKGFLAADGRWVKFGLEKYEGMYDPDVLWNLPLKNYERLLFDHASEGDYLKELRRFVLYVEKGATRMDTPAFMGVDEQEKAGMKRTSLPSHQGRVWGRRVSVSHNLLSKGVSPSLHSNPSLTWLVNAEREIAVGRASHAATLKLGDTPPGAQATPKSVYDAAHRRRR